MTGGAANFAQAVSLLTRDGGDLRVWSLIVSVFGDLAVTPGDRISGALLSAITSRIGVKPEAMRVALHRLRRDGWIISEKTGRKSHHRLSAQAAEETEAARMRIYGTGQPAAGNWSLLVSEGRRTENMPAGYSEIAPGVFLGPEGAAGPPEVLRLSGAFDRLPDWARARLGPDDLAELYRSLGETLRDLGDLLGPTPGLPPLETAVLRVLIVHHWRRLLLRHADLPDEFLPAGWPGVACRNLVTDLLSRLPRPPLEVLEKR